MDRVPPTADGPPTGGEGPTAEQLTTLDADRWGELLPHLRAALDSVPDDRLGVRGRRLRASSTGRLAGGRGRRELCDVVTSDDVWGYVRADLVARPLPDHLQWIVSGEAADAAAGVSGGGGEPEIGDGPTGSGRPESSVPQPDRRARDRERLRSLRGELDAARRRADGAEVRVAAAERDLAKVRTELDEVREENQQFRLALDVAAAEQERAVERERRRRDGEVTALREELASLRRTLEEQREDRRRQQARQKAAEATPADDGTGARTSATGSGRRLTPGRPSRLPPHVAPGTTEAVELYLHRGRRLLVDGYNVTLKHRGELDLERQRGWLIEALANLARQRGVQPTVVFDGASTTGRTSTRGRAVAVRFSGHDVTADDDIILELESTDEPVLVVTDDRELAERARSSGADVIRTHELLWVLA